MPKLPRLSGRELIKILSLFGFVVVRQKGSHIVLKKQAEESELGCVVPDHRELAEGTTRGILKQAKLTADEFLAAYHNK